MKISFTPTDPPQGAPTRSKKRGAHQRVLDGVKNYWLDRIRHDPRFQPGMDDAEMKRLLTEMMDNP
jgi:hypothetical protein